MVTDRYGNCFLKGKHVHVGFTWLDVPCDVIPMARMRSGDSTTISEEPIQESLKRLKFLLLN